MNKLVKLVGGGLVGALGLLVARRFVWATLAAAVEVEVTRITIPLRHLPPQFDGYTLVHLSDMHLGGWMTPKRLCAMCEYASELEPDVMAVTGDFVEGFWGNPLPDLTRGLSALRAREHVVGVLGNHDHRHGAGQVSSAVELAGFTLLPNRHIVLSRGGANLYLAGVDDIWAQRQNLSAALEGIPPDSAVILLAHEPDYADEVAASGQVGLQLSGHTHGGQVRIPGWGAPVLPWLGQKYDAGLFQVGGMALYVNRGLGMAVPYVRFNCRPEITHITLVADSR
jgi:predicted MPP superfamily phosphohydrolase